MVLFERKVKQMRKKMHKNLNKMQPCSGHDHLVNESNETDA